MHWICRGKEIKSHEDFTSDVIGFIYLLTYDNGQKYIGRKLIRTIMELPLLEDGKLRENHIEFRNRRKDGKIVTLEVAFQNKSFVNYEGSIKKLPEGIKLVSKEIIELCSDKINLTYAEMKHQVMCNVLTDDTYLNGNILGKFYTGKITSEVIYKG